MKLFALVSAAWLCTPCFAQWSTDSLSLGRSRLGATTVGSTALFAGGLVPPAGTSVVDLYDARTGTWSTSNLATPVWDVAAASAGNVALFLGHDGCCTTQPVVDVFDAGSGTWSTTIYPGFPAPAVPAVASLGDKIYFGGGNNPISGGLLDRVEIYDTVSGNWTSQTLSAQRGGLAATSVGDLVLFAGGHFSGVAVADVDILDTQTNTWSSALLSLPRSDLAATSVGGKALFAGGVGSQGSGILHDRVDIYDAATGTWSQAQLSQPRSSLSATSVGPYALFAGGLRQVVPLQRSDRVDIYDSRTDTWSTATLSQERMGIGATSVDGLALFAGGTYGVSPILYSDVVDVFDSRLGTMYCTPAVPNSTGLPGILDARGFLSVATNDLVLVAEQLPPGQFGYFITGLTQGFIQPPASQGPICLSGNIGRYNRASEIIQGPIGTLQIDLASMPVNPPLAALPGDTWNFQCWYRDSNPGSTSNTTNGFAVTFETPGDPSVQFAVTQRGIIEDPTLLEVRITLSQPTDQDVSVSYTTGGTATAGVDWRVEEQNPFVIPAGTKRADMTLLVAEDTAQEPTETATVTLTAATGAVLGTQTMFTLTIVDDD